MHELIICTEKHSHALLIISLPLPLKYLASCSYRYTHTPHSISVLTHSLQQKCKKKQKYLIPQRSFTDLFHKSKRLTNAYIAQ